MTLKQEIDNALSAACVVGGQRPHEIAVAHTGVLSLTIEGADNYGCVVEQIAKSVGWDSYFCIFIFHFDFPRRHFSF